MRVYNACFSREIWKIIPKLSLILLIWSPGPGCSKLMMPLVNVSLKFQMLISEICQYFLLKTCEKLLHCKTSHIFSTKIISVVGYKVVKHLKSRPRNKLVKLMML